MRETLCIIVPVYDEESCILPLVSEINKLLKSAPLDIEILFINDGSTDRSLELIENVCEEDPRYSFISLKSNRGLSTALKAGIDACDSTLIGYIDADLQTSPIDFLKLLQHIGTHDLVTGYRAKRQDKFVKKATSRIANTLRRWMLEDDIIDTACPLKIIRTPIAKQMPFFKGMHRFIPDMVILLGGTVKQVPINHFPRYAGQAKYNLMNRMFGPLIDMMVFRWMQRKVIHYEINRRSTIHRLSTAVK